MKALDVGSGSGYLVACMSQMVGAEGTIVGLEYIEPLVQQSKERLASDKNDELQQMLKNGRVSIHGGDGWQGFPSEAPFDAIHVGAAADTVPEKLLEQLKPGGRMVVPVGPRMGGQELMVIDKDQQGRVTMKSEMDVAYVPLVHVDRSSSM
jgi:protein-L-isoaspartate(D-aspartate) O-methyltransferase